MHSIIDIDLYQGRHVSDRRHWFKARKQVTATMFTLGFIVGRTMATEIVYFQMERGNKIKVLFCFY